MSRAVCNCMRLGLPRCFRTYTMWICFSEMMSIAEGARCLAKQCCQHVEDNAFHRGSIATYHTRATFDSD